VSVDLHPSESWLLSDDRYRRNVKERGPEARLGWARFAGIMFPAGMIIYAWTSYSWVPWVAMSIGILASLFFQIRDPCCDTLLDRPLGYIRHLSRDVYISRGLVCTIPSHITTTI